MEEDIKLTWGRELPGALSEKWPRDEDGEFVKAALLTRCSELDMADAMLMGMLDSYGIPALKRYPHNGGFGRTILGMSGEGVDILVPATLLEDARALMEGEPEDAQL